MLWTQHSGHEVSKQPKHIILKIKQKKIYNYYYYYFNYVILFLTKNI